MHPLAVVPDLDELEDLPPCLLSSGEATRGAFCLERAEEAFHHRIVVAVAHAAHAHLRFEFSQPSLIGVAGVLAPLVRVMQQSFTHVPSTNCHGQGIRSEEHTSE